jgi:glycosyltransferase involved in cell wall biosynthesis
MPCGIGDYTQQLCDALMKAGVEVKVWTGASEPSAGNNPQPLWAWCEVKRLVREIAATQPDLVHAQYPGRGYGHRLAPTFFSHVWKREGSGAPLVVTLHEFRIAHPLRKLAALNLIRCADALIVPAWREQQSLEQFWKSSPITVIPPSVNVPVQAMTTERRQELRASWNVKPDDVLLCHFGFIQRNKGFTRLLSAFAEAQSQMPHLKLLLIGDNSSFIPHPSSLIQLGYLPLTAVSECLSAADVCVLPYTDGVSARRTTLWTALQHGLPVITTRSDAEAENMGLKHEENIWLVSASESVEDLRAAILTLARSPSLRQKAGANGRALGKANTWENIARRTVEVYQQVTSDK